jgi:mRNA interferase MazF
VRRGELYLVQLPTSRDPRRQRAFVVVSRQLLIDSSFSSVICAPIYSRRNGLHTQVDVGAEEGLKHESSIHCDELVSITKSSLTHFLGTLTPAKQTLLDRALAFAVGITSDLFAGGS